MTNARFKELWDLLNELYVKAPGNLSINDLSHAGKVSFARKIQGELDEWCEEFIARAKAEFEQQRLSFDSLKEVAGERFESIEPNYTGGLDFK